MLPKGKTCWKEKELRLKYKHITFKTSPVEHLSQISSNILLHRLPPGCCNFSIHCWNLDIRSPNTEIRYMHDSHACHGNWGNCVVLLFVPSCCCDWSWCMCTIIVRPFTAAKNLFAFWLVTAHIVWYMCYGIENRVFHFYVIILCSSIGWGMLLTR